MGVNEAAGLVGRPSWVLRGNNQSGFAARIIVESKANRQKFFECLELIADPRVLDRGYLRVNSLKGLSSAVMLDGGRTKVNEAKDIKLGIRGKGF
jgi:hypothetical protein